MKIITIQPKEREDNVLPYPYFIDEKGMVGRQDFWKGKPKQLIGFNGKPNAEMDKKTIDLSKFLETPKKAIGLYPFFEHKDGEWFTYKDPIASVSVNEVKKSNNKTRKTKT